MNSRIVQSGRIPPPCKGGEAAASIKSCEATEAPQTGWSLTGKCSKTHSETSFASDHPVRAFSERDHFLTARPPLLCKEGNMPDSNSFTRSDALGYCFVAASRLILNS